MLTLLVWCNEGIKPSFGWQQGSLFDWVVVLCIREEDASSSVLLTQRGTYPFHPPFWSCKLWPSSMSSCVGCGVHHLMESMGSDIIPLTKHMCSFWHLHPLHLTSSLHPSSVDALADIYSRSCNFLLIHPREVLLAGHWLTAWPLLSCGIIISSLPLEIGLHQVVLVHLSSAWWTPIHKGMPTSDVIRSWFWWRMHDHPHWSITS